MRTAAALTSIGCLAIAAWLALALTVIVPPAERAADRVWIAIAIVAVYSGSLTGWLLWSRTDARWGRLAVMSAAILDLAIGGWLVSVMLVATGPVEGYVLLIGAWLVLHGIISVVLARRARARPAALSNR